MESIIRGALIHAPRSISFSASPKPSAPLAFVSPTKTTSSPLISRLRLSNATPSSTTSLLHSLSKTLLLSATAAALVLARTSRFPARAQPPPPLTDQSLQDQIDGEPSPLSHFLGSRPDAADALKSLLQRKLEAGEDADALRILRRLAAAQPFRLDWKFLMARLLNEMGELDEARGVFDEILAADPLSFEALFENALLMDRCGEGDAVLRRLEAALDLARAGDREKEARDVRLIMAQIQFLQKNVDKAIESYHQLAEEDPADYRPYFCLGVINSLLDRNEEAREQFAKYRERSPKEFVVEGFLQTPLSRMKLFGTDSDNGIESN